MIFIKSFKKIMIMNKNEKKALTFIYFGRSNALKHH